MTEDNLIQIRAWFAEYCSSFYTDNEDDQRHFILKEEHTHNVCANIIRVAAEEGLADERLLLAEATAILHDVGRFEQYHQFRTFRDSVSVDHAALGAEIIREIDLLADLFPEERDVVNHAVESHNAFLIPEGIVGEQLFFLRLLRDADKLDIWRVFIENYELPVEKRSEVVELGFPNQPYCSPEVLEKVVRRELVPLSSAQTLSDFKLLQLAWVYDLSFTESFRIVAEKDFVRRIAATLPDVEGVQAAVNTILSFIDERVAAEVSSGPVFSG
ncbi:MAG: HD domain-containing protein [Deltaproteobacteria bacterium]|nr:HD domain-containing protein [Deltaproteobacteria bacterium]TLN02843.1 MAG: HD domain-containing protein [bacterium]